MGWVAPPPLGGVGGDTVGLGVWVGLGWVGLARLGSAWLGLGRIGLGWVGLCSRVGCVGWVWVCRVGLAWLLAWVGLG